MSRRGSLTLLLLLAAFSLSSGPRSPAGMPVDAVQSPAEPPVAEADAALVEAVASRLAAGGRVLTPDEVDALAVAIVEEAAVWGFSPELVLGVMEVESRFDPFAVSAVGALGLMQVLPSTGEALARDLGMHWRGARTLFDPISNLRIGLAYLAQMRERFGHLPTALAAYNRGPSAIGRRVREGAPIPRGYAKRVLSASAETSLRPISSS